MPTTTNWDISYPAGTEAAAVHDVLQATAETVEAALNTITAGIDWTPLTLINGYAPYVGGGGYYNGLRASKSGNFIHIFGMIKNPTTGDSATTIAVLPVGLRPTYTTYTPVVTGNAVGRYTGAVTIGADGTIVYQYGASDPLYVNLNFTIPVN